MEASFVDLRNKSAEVIRALSRNERVTVLYRGKPAAVMLPLEARADDALVSAKDHPAFGMWAYRRELEDVPSHVRQLRRVRFHDL